MTKQPNAIPLRPDYARAAASAPNYVARAAFVAAKAKAIGADTDDLFRQLFPDDKTSPTFLTTRAAVAPGNTTTSGWASQLVQTAVGSFVGSLGATSAAAALIERGVPLRLNGSAQQVNIPIRTNGPVAPTWVSESNPIQVRSDALDTVPLGPERKIGSIVVMSRTLLKRSDAASLFNVLLREDASKGLDAAVFSDEDGAGAAHRGLLDGASSVSGGAGLLPDLQNLAASVSVGGSGQVIFVGGPGFAAAANLDANINATIFGSPAVAETMLIAVDPLSLVWGAGVDPEIDVSSEGVLHMSDDPDPIVASGTADPSRSLYQTDCIATRLLMPIAFAKRRDSAVAFIDGISTRWW